MIKKILATIVLGQLIGIAHAQCTRESFKQGYLEVSFPMKAPVEENWSYDPEFILNCKQGGIAEAANINKSDLAKIRSDFNAWKALFKGDGELKVSYEVRNLATGAREGQFDFDFIAGTSRGRENLTSGRFGFYRKSKAYIVNNNLEAHQQSEGAGAVNSGQAVLIEYTNEKGNLGGPGAQFERMVHFNVPYEPCRHFMVYESRVTPTVINFGEVQKSQLRNAGDIGAKERFRIELARKRLDDEDETMPFYACGEDLTVTVEFSEQTLTGPHGVEPLDSNHLYIIHNENGKYKKTGLMIGVEGEDGRLLDLYTPIPLRQKLLANQPGGMARPSVSADFHLLLKRATKDPLLDGGFKGTIGYLLRVE